MRKTMPKPGKIITVGEKSYKIIKVNALEETLEVSWMEGQERNIILTKEEWSQAGVAQSGPPQSSPPPAQPPSPEPEAPARRKRGRNSRGTQGSDR
jgi:hypothetical protein